MRSYYLSACQLHPACSQCFGFIGVRFSRGKSPMTGHRKNFVQGARTSFSGPCNMHHLPHRRLLAVSCDFSATTATHGGPSRMAGGLTEISHGSSSGLLVQTQPSLPYVPLLPSPTIARGALRADVRLLCLGASGDLRHHRSCMRRRSAPPSRRDGHGGARPDECKVHCRNVG